MRLRCSYDALGPFVGHHRRPLYLRVQLIVSRPFSRSPFRSSPNPQAKNIAVLGGGITGLSTAFHLSRDIPNAHITVYEKNGKVGGWLQSEKIEVDGGHVLFEYGPRTLRVDRRNPSILQLTAHLGLQDAICPIPKESPAARNRYLYYPDHLVRLPGILPGASALMNSVRNLTNLLTEPAFKGLIPAVITEPLKESRDIEISDESVGSFISRRFGRSVADNLVSAVMHGIYAGDIYRMSVKSLLPLLWMSELKYGRVVGTFGEAVLGYGMPRRVRDLEYQASIGADGLDIGQNRFVTDTIRSSSVFTFQHGLDQLSQTLVSALHKASNITVKTGTSVTRIHRAKGTDDLSATESSGTVQKYNYVVSTLPPQSVRQLTGFHRMTIPSRAHGEAIMNWHVFSVNVMVVNLYYSNPSLIPVRGFGYLIPRSVPLDENPERALGVIFGSESSVGQDTAPGTKLTVILGGHWWSGWEHLPDEDSGIEMALSVLERHLGISEKPLIAKARLQRDAIPQYYIGHDSRMKKCHEELMRAFGDRFRVAGSWFHGVGVNDCVRSARQVSHGISEGIKDSTGLEHFGQPDEWRFVSRQGELVSMKVT